MAKKGEIQVVKLSRSAILRKYGITPKTLEILTKESQILALPVHNEHGQALYEISSASDDILSMAQMCPYSFKGVRFPSYRYIALGALTGAIEDVHYGLNARDLECRHLTIEMMQDVQTRLFKFIPTALGKRLLAGKPPTKAQIPTFLMILEITGLSLAYSDPDKLDKFYFNDPADTHFVNQVLWTHSCSNNQRSTIISEGIGGEVISADGVQWYKHIFHDNSFMREKDMGFYLSGLHPTIRGNYVEAMDSSAAVFTIKAGMQGTGVAFYQMTAETLRDKVTVGLKSNNTEELMTTLKVIGSMLKVSDMISKVNPGAEEVAVPDHMKAITTTEYKYKSMFIDPPEFRDGKEAKENA